MILKNLYLFLQNVCKNRILTNIILENEKEFNILFIQELPWFFIQTIPSSISEEGDKVISVPNYPDWLTFFKQLSNDNKHSRVLMYINV